MWLLSTDRAELYYFSRNFDAAGGYAILSHTWGNDEQTLQEVRAIGKRCRARGTNPRDDGALSQKIRNCCITAEKHGYRWVWIDSCCIDKTSSSELSEAINSMFRWYKEAEVCFAYLADVSRYCVLHADQSPFRRSRWHARGWTLQELIAPDFLIFLSNDWHELGNRAVLASLLKEITGVPVGVLTGADKPAEYSVSIRMSWASRRKTTRVEDEAYSLMGLFGVSIPTNYGEGKHAFIRLQYEIMQHNSDMSLFTFGGPVWQGDSPMFHPEEKINHPWKYLMADSPREFDYGFLYIPDLGRHATQQYPPPPDSKKTGPFDSVELPRVAVTSYGVKLRLPIYETNGITIAVMLCEGSGRYFGLFLTRDRWGSDPTRPRYFTGCACTKPLLGSSTFVTRMADLGEDLYSLTFNRKPVKARWRTIYVVPTAYDLDSRSSTTPSLSINCNPASSFRVPRWLIARFTALQFEVEQIEDTDILQTLQFTRNGMARIYVSLGSCIQHRRRNRSELPLLWAKVDGLSNHAAMNLDTFTHSCYHDHINSESWKTLSKVFGDGDRAVRLSLTPSTSTSECTYVIHLELFGRVFEEMLQEEGVPYLFPSLADLNRDLRCRAPRYPVTSSHALQAPAEIDTETTSSRSSSSSRNSTTLSTPPPSPSPPSVRNPLADTRIQGVNRGAPVLLTRPRVDDHTDPQTDSVDRSLGGLEGQLDAISLFPNETSRRDLGRIELPQGAVELSSAQHHFMPSPYVMLNGPGSGGYVQAVTQYHAGGSPWGVAGVGPSRAPQPSSFPLPHPLRSPSSTLGTNLLQGAIRDVGGRVPRFG